MDFFAKGGGGAFNSVCCLLSPPQKCMVFGQQRERFVVDIPSNTASRGGSLLVGLSHSKLLVVWGSPGSTARRVPKKIESGKPQR